MSAVIVAAAFVVRCVLHFVPRVELDQPEDPEVGVTTSTDPKGW